MTKNEIIQNLRTENRELFHHTINKIKENGDLDIIPLLFDFIEETQNYESERAIVRLLSDIKQSRFKPVLMERLQNNISPKLRVALLEVVWESDIDFSEYIKFFTELIISGDFKIAVEAHTVISNLKYIRPQDAEEALKTVESISPASDKKALIEDILYLLRKRIQSPEEDSPLK